MKKIRFGTNSCKCFQAILLLIVLIIPLSSCHKKEKQDIGTSQIIMRPQTAQEAFEYLSYVLKRVPFYREKGYSVALPKHPLFNGFKNRPDQTGDKSRNIEIFEKEVYSPDDFTAGLSVLKKYEDSFDEVFKKLNLLNKKWGFKTFPKYEVILTLYGPGGSYDPDVGRITLLARPDGTFKEPNPFETVVHEIVHMGIENNIVRKYELTHWEKERLVDLICSHYLKDELPAYRMDTNGDTRIDGFINETVIVENLPKAVEEFIAFTQPSPHRPL